MTVKMHGPAFDSSGKMVNRDVPAADVLAYQNAGYVLGDMDAVETDNEVKEADKANPPKKPKK